MMIPVKIASEFLGISRRAISVLIRAGLVRKTGRGRATKVNYDDLITLEGVIIQLAESLADKLYHTGRSQLTRTLLYRLAEQRGLIALSRVAKMFGISIQTALKNCQRWCTMQKILNRWYVVPDEKWEAFVQRRLELARKRESRR